MTTEAQTASEETLTILSIYTHGDEVYFVAKEIATLFGYKTTTNVTKFSSKTNQIIFRDYSGPKDPYQDPRTVLLNKSGILEIISELKKSLSTHVFTVLNKYDLLEDEEEFDELIYDNKSRERSENTFLKYFYVNNGFVFNYYVSNYIVAALGFKNSSSIMKDVSERNKLVFKDFPGTKKPYLDPRTILITVEGINEIISKKRYKSIDDASLALLQNNGIHITINKKYSSNLSSSTLVDPRSHTRDLTTYTYINNGFYYEYFVGYEIAALLGYKKTNNVIKSVSLSNQLLFKDYPDVKDPELSPSTILLTKDGVVEILVKTRKMLTPDVLHILEKFQVQTTNRKCLTKEQQTLSALANAFKTEKIEDQYKVNTYYLDLYFPEHKIIVECDENGHSDRKPFDEKERMDYVNSKLNVTNDNWIRYNPDEYDFDISKVMGKIYRKIQFSNEEKKKTLHEEKEMYMLLAEEIHENRVEFKVRKCKVCGIIKDLNETNYGVTGTKSHTGYTNTCNECNSLSGKEKAVRQYDLDGTFIKEYVSVRQAFQQTKIGESFIASCCRGDRKSANEFMWKFVGDLKIDYDDDGYEADKDIAPIEYDLYKVVAQYAQDGNLVKTHKSVAQAARELNVQPRSLYGAIRNNFVSHGFVWRYVDSNEIISVIPPVTAHRKYMKQVEVYKDGELYKSFVSIVESAKYMKVNISMVRKFLAGKKADPKKLVWKFKDAEKKEDESDNEEVSTSCRSNTSL